MEIFGGTGFIGSRYVEMFGGRVVPRNRITSYEDEILYFISTTNNYNVMHNLTIDVQTNLLHFMEVLERSRGHLRCINFISSWFVYGENSDGANEETECKPRGFYSITKKCAEDLLISFCQTFGIKYRILRLCNVYGPNDKFSKEKNALQWIGKKLKNNEDVELYYGGNFTRCYMHVDDICRAINLVVTKSEFDNIINISWDSIIFRKLIDMIIANYNSKSRILVVEPSRFHKIVQSRNCSLSNNKLKQLGFMPHISIEEGIKCIFQ